MNIAVPPTSRWGSTWGWLLVIGLLACSTQAPGQEAPTATQGSTSTPSAATTTTPKSKGTSSSTSKSKDSAKTSKAKSESKAKAEAKAKADAEAAAEEEARAAEDAKVHATSVEVFKDPRAEEALTKQHPVAGLKAAKPNDLAAVKAMASGSTNLDNDILQRFVEGMAYQLVDASNIKNLVSPPPGSITRSSLNIQVAVDGLIDVMNIAKATNNASFIKAYNALLIATLPKLLDNHLVSRIQAMIVLGQIPSSDVLPILLAQLKDAKQTVWVKLWALKGLSNLTQDGVNVTNALGTDRAYTAAQAVLAFLAAEKEAGLPWPATMRAMEALGALRQATGPTSREKAEMSSAAMDVLANSEMNIEARASAGMALGLIQVSPAIPKYNYPLIGYWVGSLAADVGDAIAKEFKKNPTEAEYLSGLLIGPIAQSFGGIEGARESGLLNLPTSHPNVPPSLTYLRQIADLNTATGRAAVELVRAPKGQIPERLADLGKRVAELRDFLAKNPPKDFHLIPPGGTEYVPAAPEAPAEAGDAKADAGENAAKPDAADTKAQAPRTGGK